eukprot:9483735-Pyramimonas_sp.AAC.1
MEEEEQHDDEGKRSQIFKNVFLRRLHIDAAKPLVTPMGLRYPLRFARLLVLPGLDWWKRKRAHDARAARRGHTTSAPGTQTHRHTRTRGDMHAI